jgi:formyl-CoA transferase
MGSILACADVDDGLETTARRDGDEWVLNGAKRWIGNATFADLVVRSQPLAHWREVLDRARITYGVIQSPEEATRDPQLRPNDIVVPLEGDDALQEIISSPITVRGVPKVPARRAPDLGEHNEQMLEELGFSDGEILFAQGNLTGIAYAELSAQGR